MLTSAIPEFTENQKSINNQFSKLECKFDLTNFSNDWIYQQKRSILRSICSTLKPDRHKYTSPNDYFRATLFKVKNKDLFILDCNFFPHNLTPKTSSIVRSNFDIENKGKPTVFYCYDDHSIQIIPNIPKECEKPPKERRWVELWPGQSKQYGSMLCAPISIGEGPTKDFEILSILTIDTNRLDYFSEEKEDKNFLSNFLSNFSVLLSFLYIMEESFSKKEVSAKQDRAL